MSETEHICLNGHKCFGGIHHSLLTPFSPYDLDLKSGGDVMYDGVRIFTEGDGQEIFTEFRGRVWVLCFAEGDDNEELDEEHEHCRWLWISRLIRVKPVIQQTLNT